jgi:hypothetical protein
MAPLRRFCLNELRKVGDLITAEEERKIRFLLQALTSSAHRFADADVHGRKYAIDALLSGARW